MAQPMAHRRSSHDAPPCVCRVKLFKEGDRLATSERNRRLKGQYKRMSDLKWFIYWTDVGEVGYLDFQKRLKRKRLAAQMTNVDLGLDVDVTSDKVNKMISKAIEAQEKADQAGKPNLRPCWGIYALWGTHGNPPHHHVYLLAHPRPLLVVRAAKRRRVYSQNASPKKGNKQRQRRTPQSNRRYQQKPRNNRESSGSRSNSRQSSSSKPTPSRRHQSSRS